MSSTAVRHRRESGKKGKLPQRRDIDFQDPRNITQPAIRRLARRGGVKRVNALIYPEVRRLAGNWLEKVMGDLIHITEYSKRSTITTKEVIHVLRNYDIRLYTGDQDKPRIRRKAEEKTESKEQSRQALAARLEQEVDEKIKLATDALEAEAKAEAKAEEEQRVADI